MSDHFAGAVKADIAAPLCYSCENEGIYQRSPENCEACSHFRLTAALPHLRQMLAEEIREKAGPAPNDIALDTDNEIGWHNGMSCAADHLTRPEVMK